MKTNALQPTEAKEDLVEVAVGVADIGGMQADDPYVALQFNRQLLKNSKHLVLQLFLHHLSKLFVSKRKKGINRNIYGICPL